MKLTGETLTGETITREQIRELRDNAHSYADGDPDFVVLVCKRAMYGDKKARARCAEILNARNGASS